MAIALSEFVAKVPPDTEDRVGRQREHVIRTLQNAIRKQTGLALYRSSHSKRGISRGDSIKVPVRLVPGLPKTLRTVKFADDYWIVTVLSRYRRHLTGALESSQHMKTLCEELASTEPGRLLLSGRDTRLDDVTSLAKDLLSVLEKEDPVRRILAVNEDVLGAYRFKRDEIPGHEERRTARIELYWGVIGLVAESLGVTIESLTTVVLAHELAHAYTHMGADIDGERWSSSAFADAQHELREGLAQYYTCIVCRYFAGSGNEAFQAYKKLLERQPPAYKVHEPWVEHCTPEAVRLAMLEARRREITRFDNFNDLLSHASDRLSCDDCRSI